MFNRNTLALMAVACSAALLPCASAVAENWNAYTYINTPVMTAGSMMQKITQQVTEQTDGDLTVRMHFGGSLPIQATNITQSVSRGGTIQLADDGFPYGNVPIAGILNLPLLLTSEADFDKAVDVMRPALEKAFAARGIQILAIYHYPQQVAWSSKKLTSLADMAGSKMRVSSPQQAAFVRAFGGTPVTIGTPEVAPALQRGVVDGVFTASSGGARTWKDLLNYSYRLGPNYFASFVLVNKKAFDALDPKLQKTLESVVQKNADWGTTQMRKEEQTLTDEMQSEGMTVTAASAEDTQQGVEKMSSYWEEWASDQGAPTQALLKKVRAAIDK
ncbi:TRAP transporter substrate-binding protein DctP [Salinisphaera aquimarina]|uniref:TRAP transporter substrate-binding protein DctP n=1 Tax=Salinisphaera aquimarina TaxID=2094031 RepID=A0ABV7EKB6_9GAMM